MWLVTQLGLLVTPVTPWHSWEQLDRIDRRDKSDNLRKLVRGATCYEAHHDMTT